MWTRLKLVARWIYDQLIYPLIARNGVAPSDKKDGEQ